MRYLPLLLLVLAGNVSAQFGLHLPLLKAHHPKFLRNVTAINDECSGKITQNRLDNLVASEFIKRGLVSSFMQLSLEDRLIWTTNYSNENYDLRFGVSLKCSLFSDAVLYVTIDRTWPGSEVNYVSIYNDAVAIPALVSLGPTTQANNAMISELIGAILDEFVIANK